MEANAKLRAALIKGDKKLASQLLTARPWFGKKADLNLIRLPYTDVSDDIHPLLLWVYKRDLQAVEWALTHGADPNARDDRQPGTSLQAWRVRSNTALLAAVMTWTIVASEDETCVGIARALIRAGANPNLSDLNGNTALHRAVLVPASGSHGALAIRTQLVSLLLGAHANPNAPDAQENPPLYRLCAFDVIKSETESAHLDANKLVVDLLLEAGADASTRNKHGRTSLHQAVGTTDLSTALYVWQAARLSVDLPDRFGQSALHLAAEAGVHKHVAALLNAGASPHLSDAAGKTPLDLARSGHKTKCVELLESSRQS